ncbi:hypothetical protein [Flavobacterium sp.]|jgi:hypothetical protein|uniref:hypothetical protein n=1 Tax=Flavobacterium sp. TaxID=239 RepID=UPI0037C02ADB
MNIYAKYFLPILIVVLTPVSVNQWTSMQVGNTFTSWVLYFILLAGFIFQKRIFYDKSNDKNLKYLYLYLAWVFICVIRGIIVSDYYWDYKNLVESSFGLLISYSVFVFTNPTVVKNIVRVWLRYAIPLFFVFVFFMDRGASGYYFAPLGLLGIFYPSLNIKWKIIVVAFFLFVIVVGLDVRSNVIKFAITFLLSFLLYHKKYLDTKIFRFTYFFFLVIPFALFFLASTNVFNVFKMDEYIEGKYETTSVIGGQKELDDLKADSRTFLYEEVIGSALRNDYIIQGRTPARGNDSEAFGAFFAEDLGTRRYERAQNEVSILNIINWTGAIGIVLYFLIFFKAAQLALYRSKNSYVKIIGFYIAFRWAFAWLEDCNRFDVLNLTLWLMIAMCYSKAFRNMTDREFRLWLNGIIKRNKETYSNYSAPNLPVFKI